MTNSFDFYSVEISSPRKRSIYNAIGKKVNYSSGLSSRRVGFQNGYPRYEYTYNVGFSDVHHQSIDDARKNIDKIADQYRKFDDINVRIKYHPRD